MGGGGRELTVFAVDVSPSMAEERTVVEVVDQNLVEKVTTNLEYGLELVRNQVAKMLLAGLKTVHCGIVLFGSERTQNSLSERGYQYIWEYVSPTQPSALTLSQIDNIPLHLTKVDRPEKGDLLSVIILSNHLIGETLGKKKWSRKVVLVTDARRETDWSGLKEERSRMRRDDVELMVIGLDFDDPSIGYQEPGKAQIQATNETKLENLCRSIRNGSKCSTAIIAVSNAQLPEPQRVASNPSAVVLSLGYPGPEACPQPEDYDPQQTLKASCYLKKCTSVVRPMTAKKMGTMGVQGEVAKAKQTGQAPLSAFNPQNDTRIKEEDTENRAPSGLLQVERKGVYVDQLTEKQKGELERRADEESDGNEEAVDGQDLAGPRKPIQADPQSLAKAYKYGATRVLISKEDEERIRQTFYPSLQIRGFVQSAEIPRHHLINDVHYLYADPHDPESQVVLSALVRALDHARRVALARFVGRSMTAEPKLVVLVPVVESEARYLLLVQIPFAEDLREYFFPPLQCMKNTAHRHPHNRLISQPHTPTEEMQSAMDELVDDMDLVLEQADGAHSGPAAVDPASSAEPRPWLVMEDACSPAVHRLRSCVLHRLSHPESQQLPPVHPSLTRHLEQPPHIVRRAASSLEKVKRLMAVKPAPVRLRRGRGGKQTNARPADPRTKEDGIAYERVDLEEVFGGEVLE